MNKRSTANESKRKKMKRQKIFTSYISIILSSTQINKILYSTGCVRAEVDEQNEWVRRRYLSIHPFARSHICVEVRWGDAMWSELWRESLIGTFLMSQQASENLRRLLPLSFIEISIFLFTFNRWKFAREESRRDNRILLDVELPNFHCRNWMGNDWIIVRYFCVPRRNRNKRRKEWEGGRWNTRHEIGEFHFD